MSAAEPQDDGDVRRLLGHGNAERDEYADEVAILPNCPRRGGGAAEASSFAANLNVQRGVLYEEQLASLLEEVNGITWPATHVYKGRLPAADHEPA